ncbi:hypothetical protein [Butyrivibrio sp. XBB1001]|uniref:hypothetical protein n=1 Tax=Butyrivibrio sp. XBB1001 TaxID=1280682 RepID=UPI003FA424DB
MRDIIFDAIGFLVGIGLVALCRWLGSKHKSRGCRGHFQKLTCEIHNAKMQLENSCKGFDYA